MEWRRWENETAVQESRSERAGGSEDIRIKRCVCCNEVRSSSCVVGSRFASPMPMGES